MIDSSVLFLLLAVAGVATGVPADSLRAAAARDSLTALPRPVLTLPEVRVERDRPLAGARAPFPTAHVTELRAGEAGRAHETLPELLSQAAGVRVVQYGGLGAFATISLRGSPSGQVAMLLDGVPLNTGARSVVNLADLPMTAIERIEVYRGVAPLWLGVAAPAGAVNFVTVAAPSLSEVRVVRGSYDTWEARATTGSTRGPLALLIHAGYQGSDGDYRYPDDNGTPFNATDDSLSPRRNNRFDAGSLLAMATWSPGGARVTLRQEVFHKAQGVPGIGAVPTRATSLALDRGLSVLAVATDARALLPGARAEASLLHERSRFRDRDAELGLGQHDSDDALRAAGVNAALDWPRLPIGFGVRVSGSVRGDLARLSDAADGAPDPPESRRAARGASVDVQWRPVGAWLTLHAARRWDRLEDHLRSVVVGGSIRRADVARELDSPQLGLRATWRGFEARANWTEAERAPDFLELFGNQGTVLGNPQLVPEHARAHDEGLAWSGRLGGLGRAALEWAHFESRPRDLIHFLRTSQSSVRATNLTAAKISGDEVSARLDLAAGVAAEMSLTLQDARDRGRVPFWYDRRLPMQPARQAYGRLSWRHGRLRVGGDLHYIGDDYLDRYNRNRVPSRTIVGATASLDVLGCTVVLEGKNLGDRQVVDVANFPLPGRSVFVSIRTGFDHASILEETSP